MKKLNKITNLFWVALLGAVVFAACNNLDSKQVTPDLTNQLIGNFKAEEYGAFHNDVLVLLYQHETNLQDADEVIHVLSKYLPEQDGRFNAEEIRAAIVDLYANPLFIDNILGERKDVKAFQDSTLINMVKSESLSQETAQTIIRNSDAGPDYLNRAITNQLTSEKISDTDKNYLQVYASIYNASFEYWSSDSQPNAMKDCTWCPYAADAVGGVLGLFGGPAWSIIQGAVVSAAVAS